MANMRDIAKLAGVSVATISRILNNDVNFRTSNETRKRVKKIASNLSYDKQQSVRNKKRNLGLKLGLITRHNRDEVNTDPYFIQLRKGLFSEAAHWNLELVNLFDARKPPDDLAFLKKYDAILMMSNPDDDCINSIKRINPHIILVDYFGHNDAMNIIRNDYYDKTVDILNLLYQKGHRKIDFIGGDKALVDIHGGIHRTHDEIRNVAYQKWMKLHGLKKYSHSYITKWGMKNAYRSSLNLLKRKEMPTAVVVASDPMAIGVYKAFKEQGIRIPDDVSIVSFDDIDEASFMTPALSTVHLDVEEMGRIVIDMTQQALSNGWQIPVTIVCKSKLIIRDSIRSIK